MRRAYVSDIRQRESKEELASISALPEAIVCRKGKNREGRGELIVESFYNAVKIYHVRIIFYGLCEISVFLFSRSSISTHRAVVSASSRKRAPRQRVV